MCRQSEALADIEPVHQRIDIHGSDIGAINRNVCVDIHPARVQTDKPVVLQIYIEAGMHRQAPTVIEIKIGVCNRAGAVFVVDPGEVHPCTQKGRELGVRAEVLLQRESRRKMSDIASVGTVQFDVMLEWNCRKDFQAKLVAEEVLTRNGGAPVIANIHLKRARGQASVVGFWVDVVDAYSKTSGANIGLSTRGSEDDQECNAEFFHG